jgi:hypothetical protein
MMVDLQAPGSTEINRVHEAAIRRGAARAAAIAQPGPGRRNRPS